MKYRLLMIVLCVGTFGLLVSSTAQQTDTIIVKEGLALSLGMGYAELIIAPNPVEAKLALGRWEAPHTDERVTMANGDVQTWRSISADEKGWFSDSILRSCYVYASVVVPSERVMILEAMGNEMVYVNGSPRSGNPYCLKDVWESWEPRFDYSLLPVHLKKGKNELLFRCNRGRLKAQLYPPLQPVMFNTRDLTIPDFIVEKKIDTWGSVVIVNCTEKSIEDLEIVSSLGTDRHNTPVGTIQPMSVRKVPFQLIAPSQTEKGTATVFLSLLRNHSNKKEIIDSVSIQFRVVEPGDNHKETFISSIDGSVQYYGINPKFISPGEKGSIEVMASRYALFLSLHGASVEAINQSGSYFPKSWGHIVAPTNRRPYGFNWEGWGRLDALEVMDVVTQRYPIDMDRIYLTGHSMGGHGTWHLGSLYPDKFAAIGPSAGWISFWTYRFRGQQMGDTTEIRKMIRRSTTPSETYEHLPNFSQMGVYILHGSEDDNVPPEQSRSMVEKLQNSHNDFVYHEQPGVGHWWDISDEPGTDCVDWAPMFDFFARHARPFQHQIREIKFLTSNPSVSSTNYWLTIDAQHEQLKLSSAAIRYDPGARRFSGVTKNVARIALDLDVGYSPGNLTVELDSQKITVLPGSAHENKLWFEMTAGKWNVASVPSVELKGSHRYGTFQEAFRNNVMFVYATGGSREENKWAFDKARYDAEKLWYQGNGSVEVVADTKFDVRKDDNRNVILYGNKNSSKAWSTLLAKSPVEVGNGYVRIGTEKFRGKNLACIFVRPRAGSRNASVGVVSGTGIIGMNLNNRLPYLNPGIGLPDCTIFDSDILLKGEEGILMTGFFGLDWTVGNGEFVRKNPR